jgi:ATP-dependent Clp endopeptidase proteolytic subunit ClpP
LEQIMSKSWFTAKAARGEIPEIEILSDIGEFGLSFEDFNNALKALGPVKELLITISSNGGEVSTGFAIYDRLKRLSAHKTVRVMGLAASMASVIAMAGDEIVMPENAMLMIHNPWGGVVGEAEQIRSFSEALEMMKSNIESAYVNRTKRPAEEIRAMMNRETWLTASEAVRLGFADRVEEPMRKAASLDVSRFKNIPAGFPKTPFDALAARAFRNFNENYFRGPRHG